MRRGEVSPMGVTRRQFLKGGAALAGAVLVSRGIPLLVPAPVASKALPQAGGQEAGHPWAFVCDTTKCIGCGRCVAACKAENRVPPEPHTTRTWVERYVISEQGQVYVDSPEAGMYGFGSAPANAKYQGLEIRKTFFVPKLCNQCENPPCVRVCPVAATYMTDERVILVDQEACVGCRYCIQACPYGARYLVPPHAQVTPTGQVGVADKCTWCYHRITKGLSPACVEACPVGARLFGDVRDPASPVARVLREQRVYVLKEALGTRPKVYYIGLEEGVR
ncbi:MAG: 4Fe-4S dicluster domain-containing protein [Chloroflexi bacterium]|nr:4Fe-4S dicluster domain-containing protein [Chloroflexota bacterium]